ncbi:threonine/serine dehydratase [Solicola gregarius]|uniref:Threonine/serine dehydratase n=1 Tax=Solicola gregarius TaxID=2908642 RepID=A0AA46YKG2_9ACTN|nr:threonine/serine dehydratase [Solicola gregarius]UYM03943.1 threonine/serine dehydratase [Solicola gregarius]
MSTDLPRRSDIESAAVRLTGKIRRTPLLAVHGEELGVGARVLLKLELTQHTGSFKARGALNSVLTLPEGTRGVVAASGGNHAGALAWAASLAGLDADLFVPASSPTEKIDRIRDYGATAHVVDGYYPDAYEAALEWSDDRPVAYVHAYDRFSTVCGAGSVGLEIEEQASDADLALVACGGGGLYAGTALALRGRTRVVPVEPEKCANLHAGLAAGEPVAIEVGGVAADSLGAATIGSYAYETAAELDTEPVLVSDHSITKARRWLWQRCRVLAEPGAATPLAALMTGAVTVHPGDTVVVVISGGNNPEVP